MKKFFFNPVFCTFLILTLVVILILIRADGNPFEFARLGTRYANLDINGTQGYDGQYVYYISVDIDPCTVAPHLDVPAYRYQRIMMPLLARLLSFGNKDALPWLLICLGIFFQTAGTWLVRKLLRKWGVNQWYALIYGLWVGLLLAVRLDLPEPIAFAFVLLAFWGIEKNNRYLQWIGLGLGLFTKEVVILFVVAYIFYFLTKRDWKNILGVTVIAIIPYIIFQYFLWSVFGHFGLGSGGAMATPFEIIPFMGLLRIGQFSPLYLLMMLIVFGPAIVFPVCWGIYQTLKKFKKSDVNYNSMALIINAMAIIFLPFSTFRETGGLLRFATGFVCSFLLFCGYYKMRRSLNYCMFWLALNVFLLK